MVDDPLLASSELSESDRTRLPEVDAELSESLELLAERTRRELAELSESLELLAERTRRELAELAELSESELLAERTRRSVLSLSEEAPSDEVES